MDSSQRFNLVKDYFQSGWAFLIPYLLLYISFWIFGLPVSLLTKISYFLHGLHALALFYLIRRRKLRFDSKNIAFWSTLAVIFFFTGSSLEFPSDPWTHFRRIFLWQTIELIEECSFADKFAYFLGHSLIGWTEPIYRRLAIGLYSSACLLLLACQIYKLSKTLGLNEKWARISILSSILFLGYDNIGFFLYHGISSSQISLLASFAAIRLTLKFAASPNFSTFVFLITALLLSGLNHIQGVLIWVMAGFGVLFTAIASKFGWKLSLTLLISLLLSAGLCSKNIIATFIGSSPILIYFDPNTWILPWGGINPFGQDHLFRTLGILGLVNLIAGLWIIKKNSKLGLITVSSPIILVLSPVGILIIYILLENSHPQNFHRLLYSTLPLLATIYAIQITCQKYRINEALSIFTAVIILVFLSIFPHSPIFGKGWAFFKYPDHLHRLLPLDKTAQWLFKHIKISKNEYFLSDVATEFIVSTLLNAPVTSGLERRNPQSLSFRVKEIGGIKEIVKRREIAGILALTQQPQIDQSGSPLGTVSGHWDYQTVQKNLFFDPLLEKQLNELVKYGWIKTKVSPWYFLYIRPEKIK